MASIYGKRFDAWWERRFGPPADKAEVERTGLRAIWQVGLVLLCVIAVAVII